MRIGITIGDPGGIGPEITLKALADPPAEAKYMVYGSARAIHFTADRLRIPHLDSGVTLIDIDNVEPVFATKSKEAGAASAEYLDRALQAFAQGDIDGLVTGPINKENWHLAGYQFPGQTEFCAERTGSRDYCMLMVSDRFRIAVLTTHISLQNAVDATRKDSICERLRLLHREFKRLGFENPRFGVAALNPHAGEAGAFGSEEEDQIVPALAQIRSEGIHVEGPIAPEVIFRVAAAEQKWDVILAMYHDQAMIPLKLLDFNQSANVTLGLPLIRTSPDHGTAFDIAGKGVANAGSMMYALDLAIDWTLKRGGHR